MSNFKEIPLIQGYQILINTDMIRTVVPQTKSTTCIQLDKNNEYTIPLPYEETIKLLGITRRSPLNE